MDIFVLLPVGEITFESEDKHIQILSIVFE